MPTRDVSAAYRHLFGCQELISGALETAIGRLSKEHPSLSVAVTRLMETDGSVRSPFRLLPIPVLGVLAPEQDPPVAVAVLSRLWWTGAEVCDDLADGDYDADAVGLSPGQAGTAAAACLAVVPQLIIEHMGLPGPLRARWTEEFAHGSAGAAEGQISDLEDASQEASWAAVMRIYAGKSGAPYGRDTAMTAMLAGANDVSVHGWRVFGRLFGVLRQMANDRAAMTSEQHRDLANGTRTLLLALAAELAGPRQARALAALRARARHDLGARRALWEQLGGHALADAYDTRVDAIHHKLSALLESLAAPSQSRDLIQWMANATARDARTAVARGAA
jgi:Polyprenyl synthetase